LLRSSAASSVLLQRALESCVFSHLSVFVSGSAARNLLLSMALHLDKSGNAEVNFNALKRLDADVVEIVASSNYCAVYELQADRGAWSEKNIKGPLFLVRRAPGAAGAQHRLWVLNRSGRHNLVQDVLPTLEFSTGEGFHMFRDAARRGVQPDHALWFPDEDRAQGEAVLGELRRLAAAARAAAGLAAAAPLVAPPAFAGSRAGAAVSAGAGAGASAGAAPDHTAGRALLAMLQKGTAGLSTASAPPASASAHSASAHSAHSASASAHSASASASASSAAASGGGGAGGGGARGGGGAGPSSYAQAAGQSQNNSVAAFFSAAQQQQHAAAAVAASPLSPPHAAPAPGLGLASPSLLASGASVASALSAAAPPTPPAHPHAAADAAAVLAAAAAAAAPAPNVLAKAQLRSLLLDLLSEDAFVDLLHARYLGSIAARRAAQAQAGAAPAPAQAQR